MKKLEYPFEPNRVELELSRDLREADWKKRNERVKSAEKSASDGIVEAGKLIHRQYSKKDLEKTLSTTGDLGASRSAMLKSMASSKSILKSLVKEEHLPVFELGCKRVLRYRDLGYANSTNHIKAWK